MLRTHWTQCVSLVDELGSRSRNRPYVSRTPELQNHDEIRGDSSTHARGREYERLGRSPRNSANIARGQGCPNADAPIASRHLPRDPKDKRTPINGRRSRSDTRPASCWAPLRWRPGAREPDRAHKRPARNSRCAGRPPGIMPLSSVCLRTASRACQRGIIIEGGLVLRPAIPPARLRPSPA